MTILRAVRAALLLAFAVAALASPITAAADAGQLLARHEQLREQLRSSPFGRGLHIDSAEQPDHLRCSRCWTTRSRP
jgi:hypothetical protein